LGRLASAPDPPSSRLPWSQPPRGVPQGQVFGEMGLFLGARRSLTAVAVEFVELLELDRAGFVELQRDNPQVRHAMHRPHPPTCAPRSGPRLGLG
jgi:hypothetical protein